MCRVASPATGRSWSWLHSLRHLLPSGRVARRTPDVVSDLCSVGLSVLGALVRLAGERVDQLVSIELVCRLLPR